VLATERGLMRKLKVNDALVIIDERAKTLICPGAHEGH
jgi:hypothetical protein